MPIQQHLITSAIQPYLPINQIYVAYSGGVDSTVLLSLCADIPSLQKHITAVYIHHGLQACADDWSVHCQHFAQSVGVNFITLSVNAHAQTGESPEEAARNARYQAFRSLIGKHDILMLGQHREDQLETVLLQLFRGSGVQGLSGMPKAAPWGEGIMLRPLLDTPKQAVLDYAHNQNLQWVTDPTNTSHDYDRNYLRNAVMPLLKQRWPALDKTVSRSAHHCQEAQQMLSVIAEQNFQLVFEEPSQALSITRLLALAKPQQSLVIRQWFKTMELRMPSQAVVERIFSQLLTAKDTANPQLAGQGYCLRRYRDKLYGTRPQKNLPSSPIAWTNKQAGVALPDGRFLHAVPAQAGILQSIWQDADIELHFRRGGEKIVVPNRTGSHTLKNLYQEAGIPPWVRPYLPLVYINGKLAAVGDRWIDARFYQTQGQCIRLQINHEALV